MYACLQKPCRRHSLAPASLWTEETKYIKKPLKTHSFSIVLIVVDYITMPNSIEEFDRLDSVKYHDAISKVILAANPQMDRCTAEQFVTNLVAYRELKKERKASAIASARQQLATTEEVHTSIITLSLDKKIDKRETVKKIKEIIDFVSTLSYLEEPILSCEFFSDNGYNPHIHIFSYNSLKITSGVLAQRLRRQLVPKYPIVYRVNCKRGRASNQATYLISLKANHKREHQEKDVLYRKENGLLDYYLI